jgi:hypothetical protein
VADEVTLTQEQLAQLRPSPAELAQAVRLVRDAERLEESDRTAQERIVVGAFGSWFKRRWKTIVGIGTVVLTVSGGGYRAWLWIQSAAEATVIERQTTERQSKAVNANTESVEALSQQQSELNKRVEGVERGLETTTKMGEVILELQLRDPKVKRMIKNDNKLKKKLDNIPGVEIDD